MAAQASVQGPRIEPERGVWPALRRRLKRLLYCAPGREGWQKPAQVVAALGLEPGQLVADVGAGSGYFTFRLARAVSPGGRAYAVDTDRDMLWMVQQEADASGIDVVPLLVEDERLSLPERVDLVFLSHSYHHLPDVVRYMSGARDALRAGGRVAVVEGRPRGVLTRLFGHVTEPARLSDEMARAGYQLLTEHDFLERDSFLVFEPGRTT